MFDTGTCPRSLRNNVRRRTETVGPEPAIWLAAAPDAHAGPAQLSPQYSGPFGFAGLFCRNLAWEMLSAPGTPITAVRRAACSASARGAFLVADCVLTIRSDKSDHSRKATLPLTM